MIAMETHDLTRTDDEAGHDIGDIKASEDRLLAQGALGKTR